MHASVETHHLCVSLLQRDRALHCLSINATLNYRLLPTSTSHVFQQHNCTG